MKVFTRLLGGMLIIVCCVMLGSAHVLQQPDRARTVRATSSLPADSHLVQRTRVEQRTHVEQRAAVEVAPMSLVRDTLAPDKLRADVNDKYLLRRQLALPLPRGVPRLLGSMNRQSSEPPDAPFVPRTLTARLN